jgi:hypothetical protein
MVAAGRSAVLSDQQAAGAAVNLSWSCCLLLWFLGACLSWEFLGTMTVARPWWVVLFASVIWPIGVVLRIWLSKDWREK